MQRRSVLAAASLAAVCVGLGLAPPAGAGTALRFGRPTISGIQGNGFEQDLRLDTHGDPFTSVPASLSSGTGWIWRSLDGGKTFKWVPAAAPFEGKILPECPVGGGDTELAFDTGDHLFFNDLTLAPNFSTARSDDLGVSFAPPPPSCSGTPADILTDRQWYAADGDVVNGNGTLYLAYDLVGQDPSVCRDRQGDESVANNELVLARSPIAGADRSLTAGVEFAPAHKINKPCNEGIMGNDEVSPVTQHIFVIHDDADLDGIYMARCEAVPFAMTADGSGLRCVDRQVVHFEGSKTGANFPTMAIDQAGTLYAVWAEAPLSGGVPGDTALFFASSKDEGDHWTTPVRIPTPGLANNVFPWPAAGSAGRVDIAWYGTPAHVEASNPNGCTGPDSVQGEWSLWAVQTLNAAAAHPTFTAPVPASEHFTHEGNIQTLIGAQCGDRTLGDFLQARPGPHGELEISYADSNNQDESTTPHGMFVRQVGGPSLFAAQGSVPSAPRPSGSVADAAGDARYEYAGTVSASIPELDVLSSRVTRPDAAHYRITMKVADLRTLTAPTAQDPDTTLVWSTQWLVPCAADPNGGKNFFVYMESIGGGQPTFWAGENASTVVGGGVALTYPGTTQLATGVSYTPTAPGTIRITVPISVVTDPACPANATLYSVTASTMTLDGPAEDPALTGGIGGHLFNLIDAAPAYDATP